MSTTARFHALDLSSRFQPIFGLAERAPIGYEALLTARDAQGRDFAPAALFAQAQADGETIYLDWLARTLHLRNFGGFEAAPGARLFVNVAPATAIEDVRFPSVFASVMESFEIDPTHLIVEILEHAVEDEARLVDAAAYYRAFGCAIALDDFGTSASGEERLVRLRPEVVKVARALVGPAATDPAARRRLCDTVAMIHAFGATAVLEGIETRAEARAAIETGAECVQGYYFGRPSAQPPEPALVAASFSGLAPTAGPGLRRAPRPAPWPIRAFGTAW